MEANVGYGAFSKTSAFKTTTYFWYDWIPNYLETRVYTKNANSHKVPYVMRSGSSLNAPLNGIFANPRPLVQVVKTLYNGPRLPYQVYVLKINRWVWARQPLQIVVLKKAPYKKKKLPKGLNLPSNSLNSVGGCVEYFGQDLTIVANHDSGVHSVASGNLWWDFPSVGEAVRPSPDAYLSGGPSDRYVSVAAELSDALIPILYKKIKNQDVNLGQALAEYHQTANMFLETLTRCGKALLALKRGNLLGAAGIVFPKTPKDLANDWLVFQYGVKPLLSDIDGAAKLLAVPEPRYFDIIVKRKKDLPRYRIDGYEGLNGAFYSKTDVYVEGFVEVKYKVKIRIDANVPNDIERLLTRLGLGNLNAVAWEVIPWSFIIDWVIPIGDYLNNLDAFGGVTVVSSQKTTFVKERVVWSRKFGGYQFGWRTEPSSPCGFINERFLTFREVGIPIPELPKPTFKNPFSTTHALNAFALFTQLRSSH